MNYAVVLERQRRAPQYHERVAAVRATLQARHVAPEIVERVLRLNLRLDEGEILRGIHYSGFNDPRFYRDCVTKGWVIRNHGRDVWNRIQPAGIFKRGRRKYAKRTAIQMAVAQ